MKRIPTPWGWAEWQCDVCSAISQDWSRLKVVPVYGDDAIEAKLRCIYCANRLRADNPESAK